jgi:pSer/pThr/pTyr-binding forkhead associated (FHA) protein
MGADPRLNSIHLTDARRLQYRHAREVLLQSRGQQTLCAIHEAPADQQSRTIVEPAVSAAPPGEYWLSNQGRVYPLKLGVNTIGRSADNDVVVEDGCVSRRHCAILVHVTSGCELHDTASKNGTLLNGVRLAGPTRLRPGDEIKMCDQQFVFQARSDEPEQPDDDVTFAQ